MKKAPLGKACLGIAACAMLAAPLSASSVYVALGDSITFGETNLAYTPSNGDRGYVADFANTTLAVQNGGIAPQIVNLAIDGETASSFMTGMGRTPPVVGRTDAILAAENTHYSLSPSTSQLTMFQNTVSAEKSAGNTINTISITLGFNELGALASLPTSQALAELPSTLSTYETQYKEVLTDVRALAPSASLYLLGYYNPFPADPSNPAAPIFAKGGPEVNSIIASLAGEFDAHYVNTEPGFAGKEASLTYLAQYPAGAMAPGTLYTGVEPIGNVHPNAAGYSVIASEVAASTTATPEPASLGFMAVAAIGALASFRKRQRN